MFRVKNIIDNTSKDYNEHEFVEFTYNKIKECNFNTRNGFNPVGLNGCLNYITNFNATYTVEDRRFNMDEYLRLHSIVNETINDLSTILQDIYNIHLDYDSYETNGNEIEITFERYDGCGGNDYDYKTILVSDLTLTKKEFTEKYTEIKRKSDEKIRLKREEAERLQKEKQKIEREKQERATYLRLKEKYEKK